MEVFNENYFNNCVLRLSESKTVEDVFHAWLNLCCLHPELDAIVALPNYDRVIPLRHKVVDSHIYRKYLVHYFSKENLYFINDELIRTTIKNNRKRQNNPT